MTTLYRTPAQKLRDKAVRRTDGLCKELVALAAFSLDNPKSQKKIYETVRLLQILRNAAVAAEQ